jgi:hypothetical protein
LAHHVPARLSAREGRRFAFTVGIAFLALAGLLWWRAYPAISAVSASLGGLLLLCGAIIPHRLGPVYSAWMRLALMISKITTPVLMAIVYFLVITPIGLIRRLAGKRSLGAKTSTTRWHPRGAHSRSDLGRQF